MFRCVNRATIASSFLRVNFEPGPTIGYQPLPFDGAAAPHRLPFAKANFHHNSLAYVGDQSDSCERGNHRLRRKHDIDY